MTDDDRPTASASTAPVAERWHRRRMRQIIGALSALALMGGIGGGVAAVTSATSAFSESLGPRLALAGGPTGAGLRFGDLDATQRAAAVAVLEQALGAEGYAQLTAAMAADDELDAALGGGTGWGSDDYRVALLTDPDGDGFFFQFGGRQLAVNAIYRDGFLLVEPELDV